MSTQRLTFEDWKNCVSYIFKEKYEYLTWLNDHDDRDALDAWNDEYPPDEYVAEEVSFWHD